MVSKMKSFPHCFIVSKFGHNKCVFNSLIPFNAEIEIKWDRCVNLVHCNFFDQAPTVEHCLKNQLVLAIQNAFTKWHHYVMPPVCVDITGCKDFDLTFLHHPEYEFEGQLCLKHGASIFYSVDGCVRLFDVIPTHKQIMQREFNGKKLGFFI